MAARKMRYRVVTKKALQSHDDHKAFAFGGAKEDRTPDLLNAIQALSQLSYSPEQEFYFTHFFIKNQANSNQLYHLRRHHPWQGKKYSISDLSE